MQEVLPEIILPSQNFLKEKTVRYIFDCMKRGALDELPPAPLVRVDEDGSLIAIDGHNLIAVKYFLHEPIDVIVATSAQDGLPPTSEPNIERNRELAEKFHIVLEYRRQVEDEGIGSFFNLIQKYPDLFSEN